MLNAFLICVIWNIFVIPRSTEILIVSNFLLGVYTKSNLKTELKFKLKLKFKVKLEFNLKMTTKNSALRCSSVIKAVNQLSRPKVGCGENFKFLPME